jgi:alpha-ketoglutarate-dependent taurine dioxygenase
MKARRGVQTITAPPADDNLPPGCGLRRFATVEFRDILSHLKRYKEEIAMVSVKRVGNSFVAEVSDVDLSRDLSAETWQQLHDAYLEHKVLYFHDQQLAAKQLCRFGERFGEIVPHTIRRFWHEDDSRITVLSNRVEYGKPKGIKDAGSFWHSDWSYLERLANVTMLYAVEIPTEGGDTLFCDLAAAYDALSPAMKERLASLKYVCQYRYHKDRNHPESRWQIMSDEERAESPERTRPIIRTHPETGRKSIFVFDGVTGGVKNIVGMSEANSDDLLAELYEHTKQPQFQHRYEWRGADDLLMWDNRCTMHAATTADLPPTHIRELHRISTLGSIPA